MVSKNSVYGIISNTRKSVSSDIQTLRSGLEKRGVTDFFFNQLRSVWTSDETLFRMFDIASRSIDNSKRNSNQTFAKFCDTVFESNYPTKYLIMYYLNNYKRVCKNPKAFVIGNID